MNMYYNWIIWNIYVKCFLKMVYILLTYKKKYIREERYMKINGTLFQMANSTIFMFSLYNGIYKNIA